MTSGGVLETLKSFAKQNKLKVWKMIAHYDISIVYVIPNLVHKRSQKYFKEESRKTTQAQDVKGILTDPKIPKVAKKFLNSIKIYAWQLDTLEKLGQVKYEDWVSEYST